MANQSDTRPFNLLLYILSRLTIIPYVVFRYRIKNETRKIFKNVKPPFILIPNHVSMLDPVIVNSFIPHRIHFVMSDANLRTRLARWVYLKGCRVIPKTKAVSDTQTVRRIIRLIRKNRVICVFPEGRSSWDGVSHDIFFSTAKLLKILKIPVIVPLIQGGYLTHPRWGTSVRPGKMVIHYKKIFDGPELEHMYPENIHHRLLKELWNDDYDYQLRNHVNFKTRKGAEYLERLLFVCPVCKSKQTMHSEGNRFFCSMCQFETRWTPEGYLKPAAESDEPVRSITQWAQWQNRFCERQVHKMIQTGDANAIFSDKGVTLFVGFKDMPLNEVMRGTLELYTNRFVIKDEQRKQVEFPIQNIDGVQVLLANRFEFYFNGSLYKFEFSNPRTSGFKYMWAIQKIAPEKAELE